MLSSRAFWLYVSVKCLFFSLNNQKDQFQPNLFSWTEGKPWCEYLFIVMLVNFCFQVVLGRLFRDYLSFDRHGLFPGERTSVLWHQNYLWWRSSKTRPDFGIMTGVLSNWVRIVLGHFFWDIWTFDAIAKCLTSSFLFLKPHLGHSIRGKMTGAFKLSLWEYIWIGFDMMNSIRGKTLVWKIAFMVMLTNFLLRIHLNFWCNCKVPDLQLFVFKTSFGTWWTP